MKVSIMKPDSANVNFWVPELRRLGCEVEVNQVTPGSNFILVASHSQFCSNSGGGTTFGPAAFWANEYPKIPLINYHWDLYEWSYREHYNSGYFWKGYGDFLRRSVEIWCPSEEVVLRTAEFYGQDVAAKCKIIKTAARFFEADRSRVRDGRYVYNPIRDLPGDRNFGWLERATKEHNIPLYKSLHKLSEEEFQKVILECSFLVCELYEASTGGLTLLEGFHHGKPCLISDSPYMGARDYFGDSAFYYRHDDYEDFERVVLKMWNDTPKLKIEDCRKLTSNFSEQRMSQQMFSRLRVLHNG